MHTRVIFQNKKKEVFVLIIYYNEKKNGEGIGVRTLVGTKPIDYLCKFVHRTQLNTHHSSLSLSRLTAPASPRMKCIETSNIC